MPAITLSQVVQDGPEDGVQPPLLIAHGLFGSARNWGAISKRLSAERSVVAVDMRNHGDSPRGDHDYRNMAEDLAATVERSGTAMDVLGHSMGGKAAMMLALTRPDLVNRLIVADIAPVAYDHSHTAHIEAMRSLDLSGIERRSEADARLAQTLPDAGLRAFFLQSLDLRDGPRWKLDLDRLEAGMPASVGWPDVEGRFDGPALFLAGGASTYLTAGHHDAVRSYFPNATFQTLDGAGHWLHAEQPRPFVDAVARFLSD
ncbi:alpha/beta fold hydrolase [Roseobacter sp. HKCCA0434]|uniref:alpha/beta fold hydrolase n=1 Tax=Roseobacter sp. HKCCA0434 TaxID=3079297 RepID=UPI0029059195|nr:alpha/beta fold hydrolase [Roseobacter sp. HKCCA0434]